MQLVRMALSLALDNAGNSMAARMAIIAMTTSNSINVNPGRRLRAPRAPPLPGPVCLLPSELFKHVLIIANPVTFLSLQRNIELARRRLCAGPPRQPESIGPGGETPNPLVRSAVTNRLRPGSSSEQPEKL